MANGPYTGCGPATGGVPVPSTPACGPGEFTRGCVAPLPVGDAALTGGSAYTLDSAPLQPMRPYNLELAGSSEAGSTVTGITWRGKSLYPAAASGADNGVLFDVALFSQDSMRYPGVNPFPLNCPAIDANTQLQIAGTAGGTGTVTVAGYLLCEAL